MNTRFVKAMIVFCGLLMMTACVKTPTRNTQVVDDRPGLAFKITDRSAADYIVRIDHVEYGKVREYEAGKRVLMLVDGTHQLELLRHQQVVYQTTIYLGAGSRRIINVGRY